jgi:hypothetical protein
MQLNKGYPQVRGRTRQVSESSRQVGDECVQVRGFSIKKGNRKTLLSPESTLKIELNIHI